MRDVIVSICLCMCAHVLSHLRIPAKLFDIEAVYKIGYVVMLLDNIGLVVMTRKSMTVRTMMLFGCIVRKNSI